MDTIRLTTAGAIVRWMVAQRTVIDGRDEPVFPGVFGIFGHGNVTCLGLELQAVQDELPTWRGQNEQGMALAAVAYAKAMKARQIMVATSSIGPGAANMITAAGVAMANRLPVLLIAGDTFASRVPDPVLQQVEHFGDPTITVNDAFKPVVRYWDRIMAPEQILSSLPQALATMLDPADRGPAFIALPQDVQAEAYDFPLAFFERRVHRAPRPRPDTEAVATAVELLRGAKRPLIIAGGGVHYSGAEQQLADFAAAHGIPVVETMAGRSCLLHTHPSYVGPLGVTGCDAANNMAAEADVILALGTRLLDFTTGSWTIFRNPDTTFISVNAARFDAYKHRQVPVIGDVAATLDELALGAFQTPASWQAKGRAEHAAWQAYIATIQAHSLETTPTYAQVVGAVADQATPADYALAAAGGFPGELNNGWRTLATHSFDCEYGFSCMGYELSGAWGARMARPDGEVFVFCGDGSYLMMNSDLYSTVLAGHKLIVVMCDNGGYAVINRLQTGQGGEPFNNLLADCRSVGEVRVDFAAHAQAMGCHAIGVDSIDGLKVALREARAADRTTVIVIRTDPYAWTEGGAFWEVGVPEVSARHAVVEARATIDKGKLDQRIGW
jgi:3D-(3,5/4)-trihydroxycyclohexane-1,2-dione acylhydrolase (decyclizing)